MAHGASPSRLWLSTTFDALKSVGVGLAAGIVIAMLAFRLVSTLLTGMLPPPGWCGARISGSSVPCPHWPPDFPRIV